MVLRTKVRTCPAFAELFPFAGLPHLIFSLGKLKVRQASDQSFPRTCFNSSSRKISKKEISPAAEIKVMICKPELKSSRPPRNVILRKEQW